MKATELRIGNLIYVEKKQQVEEVNYLTKTSIGYGAGNFAPIDSLLGYFNPIPLTEEWLLKFGFIECEGKYGTYFKCSKLDGFRTWFHETEHYKNLNIGRKDYDNDETIFIHEGVKFVHQLQNLYFALTGEELTI